MFWLDIQLIISHRRGVALIIVMIVVSGLSILAFGLAFRARVRMKTFALNVQNVQAYHLALGGIEKGKVFLAENILNEDPQIFDMNIARRIPFADQLSEEEMLLLSEGKDIKRKLEYAVFDESGFININKTNPVNLMKLDLIDEAMVSRIIDWMDQDSDLEFPDGAESDYYMQQSRSYVAKNEEFTHLRELLFIKDVEVDEYLGKLLDMSSDNKFNLFAENAHGFPIGLVNLFSVHGDGKWNVNTTPAVILALMTGFDLPAAEMLVDYRQNLASDEYIRDDSFLKDIGLEDKKMSFNQYCCFNSNIFRIYSFGEVGQGCCCLIAIVEYKENKLKTLSLERLF